MAQQNMGGTFLSNLVTRPEFLQYTAERIFEQSAFLQSGVITRNAALDARAGGTRVRVPFFDNIGGLTEEVITSGNSWGTSGAGYLTSQNVTADEQIMTILHRGFQFATDDLSRLGSGADPLGHVANQLAGAIARKKSATLLAQLGGLFGNIAGSGVLGGNTTDVTGTTTATASNYLTAANVVTAKANLGERSSELTAIAMHSNVAHYLEQTGYLQVQVSGSSLSAASGLTGVSYNTFAGLRVIIDDQIGVISGGTATHLNKYPVYLFGAGVIAEGVQQELLPGPPDLRLSLRLPRSRHQVVRRRRQPHQRHHQRQPGRHRLLGPGLHRRAQRPPGAPPGQHPLRHRRLRLITPDTAKPPQTGGFFYALYPSALIRACSCLSNTPIVSTDIL